MVTSQVDPKDWKGLFEDPIITHTYDGCDISNYEYISSYPFKKTRTGLLRGLILTLALYLKHKNVIFDEKL